MSIPVLLFGKIAQLFVFLLLGFISVKTRLVKSEDSSAFSKILLYLLTPAIVLEAFDVEMTPEIMKGFILSFVAAFATHIVMMIIDYFYRKTLRPGIVERACAMYSNCGNLLIPIVISILGKEWVIYSSGFLCVQLFFIWTHALSLYSGERCFNFKKIFGNIILISVIVGATFAFTGIRLPSFVKGITGPLSDMVGPISMIICGMIATEVRPKSILRDRRLYIVMLIRMVITPAICLVLIRLARSFIDIPNVENVLLITYLAIIAPTGASAVQFAQIYDKEPDFAVSVNIITTILCIATMPVFVALYLM